MATPTLKLKGKTVTVKVYPALGTAQPDTFEISKSNKEEVHWVSADGTPFTVHFDKSPFKDQDFDNSTHSHSGPARNDVKGDGATIYHYHVKPVKGQSFDPGGIINP